MKRSVLRMSTALVMCIVMLVCYCSCSEDAKQTAAGNGQTQSADRTDQSVDNAAGNAIDVEFEEHHFENGVCKDCSKDWQTCLYEAFCRYDHTSPNGQYVEINIEANGGDMELVSNGDGYMITYESKVENDMQLSYTLRTYKDPFEESSGYIFAADMSLRTHYNKLSSRPDSPQIVLVSTYEGNSEDLLKACETGDIFKGEEPFTAYFYTDNDGRKYYSPTSKSNDMTLEEMFEGSTLITQEDFNSIYLDNYKDFLTYIDSTLNSFNMSLSDIGIKLG